MPLPTVQPIDLPSHAYDCPITYRIGTATTKERSIQTTINPFITMQSPLAANAVVRTSIYYDEAISGWCIDFHTEHGLMIGGYGYPTRKTAIFDFGELLNNLENLRALQQ